MLSSEAAAGWSRRWAGREGGAAWAGLPSGAPQAERGGPPGPPRLAARPGSAA